MNNNAPYLPIFINRLINKGLHKITYLQELANRKGKEAILADRYSSSKYTFDQAYKDARNKGQRTFFWNGKYYNTDYEGLHGKQYKADVASGKATAWEQQYPGFTNPELRKEKQEELDTYGITNEQTKNKTWKDRQFKKIPARGYDINDVISSIRGEHHTYSQYNNVEELIAALRKKYPEFKNIPLSGGFKETVDGTKAIYLDDIQDKNLPPKADSILWQAFLNDIEKYDKFRALSGNPTEIHRPELNYLLGYPLDKQDTSLFYGASNKPIISKYKVGKEPYYYTTSLIELSQPFVPKKILDIQDERLKEEKQMDSLYSSLIRPNVSKLPSPHTWDEFVEADDKDMMLPENIDKYKKYQKYIDNRLGHFDEFQDKYYSDSSYRKKWDSIGAGMYRGGFDIHYPVLFRRASNLEIDSLGRMGAFDHIEPLEMLPGNRLAGSGNDDYYIHDKNYSWYTGKYQRFIDKINISKEDHNKYSEKAYNTDSFIYSEPSLGIYTYSVPKDSSYISIWDKFDIDPFGSGNDKPIIKVGRPFEYYTRFYPEGKTPNIDSLYTNFKIK